MLPRRLSRAVVQMNFRAIAGRPVSFEHDFLVGAEQHMSKTLTFKDILQFFVGVVLTFFGLWGLAILFLSLGV